MCLSPNLNAATPNPTFYTVMGGNMAWWNGTTWVNTGHSMPNVNLGAGGGNIYSLNGGTGSVYVYNGTGNSTLLTTVGSFGGGGPYDIATDCLGNWTLIKCTTPQWMNTYSPTGALLCTYSLSGMPSTSAGGGFAIVNNVVYVRNTSGFFAANITASSTLNFTLVSTTITHPGDFAQCPNCPSLPATAVTNGTMGCGTPTVNVVATTTASPVTYSWTGPGLTGPTNASVAVANAPGTYSCTISMGGCPPMSTVVTTTVTSNGTVINPSLTVSNTITCANPNSTITVTPGPPGYTYTWTGPGITGGAGTATITVNQTGTYSVAVASTTNSCQGSQSVSVVSNTTAPIVTSTPTGTSICFGQSTGFTAAGASTYTWNTGATTAAISVTPNITTSYTVVGTNAVNGCTNSAVSTVTVIPLPTPNANSNSPICVGATLNLNGSGGTTYLWNGPNSFMSVTQNPSIPNVTLAEAGIYTLTAISGACTGTTTTSVTINPLPVPTATNSGPVCEGVGINFTGTGGVFYSWTGPAGFVSNSATPGILVPSIANSGAYIVTVTDANGCMNTATTTAVINPLPAISISGSTVCANQTINLGASGGTNYNWTGPNGFSSTLQNPTIPNCTPSMAGTYSVIVTDANNCSSSSSTVVVINPIPTPSANNNGPICTGQTFILGATGGVTYQWNGPNGFTSTGQSPVITPATTGMSGTYTVTAFDNIGCSATAITSAIINPLPNPTISSGKNYGCVPFCVSFTVSNSTSIQNVQWSVNGGSGANGNTYDQCFSSSGIYTVTADVTDANGCKNSTTYLVDAYPVPVADFNFSPIKPIINNDDVTFTDATYNATIQSWNWYFYGNASATSNVQNPVFYYPEAGTYPVTLVVKSDKGCIDTLTKIIVIGEDFGIYVPNAFTPNGDGLNDTFFPKGFGIVKYQLQIFDRWGERIYETKEFNAGWDGTHHGKGINYGKICEDGVYTWLINVTNVFGKAHELKGHVTLIK